MSSRLCQDWLTSYLEFMKRSEPPILYNTWTAISVIAACLRRKCKLKWGNLTFYPNMYIILVGPSGKCRKGTAMGPGEDLLVDIGIKIASTSITREALIHQLKVSSDTSIDPNTNQMHMHSSLTIFSKELTVFLGYNNQQLMADLTDWYDCANRWEYRTKNMGTDDITGVWVNLIGATTPDLLQTTLPRDAIGGGLTSRMVFVYENKKHHSEPAPFQTPEEMELLTKLRIDLERICMMQGEFRVTPEFIEKWIPWYLHTDSSPPPFEDHRFSGYFERRPTHMFKLCMILSASKSDSMLIDASDFDRALAILARTEVLMPHTFSGLGKSTHSDTLNRVMAVLGARKKVKISELQKMFYNDADAKVLEGVVQTILNMEYAFPSREGTESYLLYNEEQNVLRLE